MLAIYQQTENAAEKPKDTFTEITHYLNFFVNLTFLCGEGTIFIVFMVPLLKAWASNLMAVKYYSVSNIP